MYTVRNANKLMNPRTNPQHESTARNAESTRQSTRQSAAPVGSKMMIHAGGTRTVGSAQHEHKRHCCKCSSQCPTMDQTGPRGFPVDCCGMRDPQQSTRQSTEPVGSKMMIHAGGTTTRDDCPHPRKPGVHARTRAYTRVCVRARVYACVHACTGVCKRVYGRV